MATYQAPGITVHQVLTETNSAYTPDQNVLIIGGHALLTTYTASGSRKNEALFGDYVNGLHNKFDWKRNATSGVADESYTRIFLENALLRYATVAGGNIPENSLNEVVFDEVLQTANGYEADALFGERGVRVGDAVHVVYGGGGSSADLVDLWTKVAAVKAGKTDNTATDAPVTADASNLGARGESAEAVSNNPALSPSVTLSVDPDEYKAPSTGLFTEKYILTAVRGTTGADLSTAEFTLLSESGLDDHQAVVFTDWDTPLSVGKLDITFEQDTEQGHIETGASWTITANEAYDAPVFAVNGTYKGATNTTYLITVKKGGTLDQAPVLVITTTLGNDTIKEIKVTSADVPLPLGNKGLTITLTDGTQLRQGDIFTYNAVSSTFGPSQQIILAENVTPDEYDRTVSVEFFTVQQLELEQYNADGQENWITDQTGFTIAPNITFTSIPGFADTPLPLVKASVYASTRIWQREIGTVVTVSNLSELDTYLAGDLVPDNPLKYGVYKALQNSVERPVMFTAVADPSDTQAWTDALVRLERNRNVYNIVPLTFDETVQNLITAHVLSMSTSKAAKERMGWFCRPVPTELPLYVYDIASNEPQSLCTVIDNPNAAGEQFTYLIATNQPNFNAKGVRFGDVVRMDFYIDNTGKERYTEYVIDSVVNNTTLILKDGLSRSINTPQRFEVWRPITLYNASEAIDTVNIFDSRRFITTWPNWIYADGATVPGYFAAAASAAVAASSLPQQSITQHTLTGFSGIPDFEKYTDEFLNDLTTHGIFVHAETEDGDVVIRHAVTTGNFDNLNEREEMSTRNFDSVTKYYRARLSGIINKVNAIESGLYLVRDILTKTGNTLKLMNYSDGLGGHIVDYEIVKIEIDPIFEDACIAHINLTLAKCLNRIDLYLQI